jgi:hypothetical protein
VFASYQINTIPVIDKEPRRRSDFLQLKKKVHDVAVELPSLFVVIFAEEVNCGGLIPVIRYV